MIKVRVAYLLALAFLGWATITQPRSYSMYAKFYPAPQENLHNQDAVAVFIDNNVTRSNARCTTTRVIAKSSPNEPAGDFAVASIELFGIQDGQRFRFVEGKCNDPDEAEKPSLEGRLFGEGDEVTSYDVDTYKRKWFVFQKPPPKPEKN